MKITKKHIVIIVVVFAVILFIGTSIHSFITRILNGETIYIGNGWQETPEEAVEVSGEKRYKIAKLLDILYFDDRAEVLYVSEDGALVEASCVKNEKEQWHLQGVTDDEDLQNPCYFILNGKENQEIMFPYTIVESEKLIYGYCYSENNTIVVNKNPVKTKNYVFEVEGKKYSIDYWYAYIEDIDNVEVCYQYENGTFSKPIERFFSDF